MLPETPAHFQVLKSEESRIKGVDELKDVCSNRIWLPIIKSDDLKSISNFNSPSEKWQTMSKTCFLQIGELRMMEKNFKNVGLWSREKTSPWTKIAFQLRVVPFANGLRNQL